MITLKEFEEKSYWNNLNDKEIVEFYNKYNDYVMFNKCINLKNEELRSVLLVDNFCYVLVIDLKNNKEIIFKQKLILDHFYENLNEEHKQLIYEYFNKIIINKDPKYGANELEKLMKILNDNNLSLWIFQMTIYVTSIL